MNNKSIKKPAQVTLDELFNVLNFYADKDHYDWNMMCGGFDKPKMAVDCGSKARKILKKFLKDGFFYATIK